MMKTPFPSTLELLKWRKATNSAPGNRNDPYNIAVVIEGGGMRGCGAAGMTAALSRLGYLNHIDEVIGTSAGAIGGAYLVADQSVADVPIYPTDLATSKFISPWRLFRAKKPIMDLDYLFNTAMGKRRRISMEKISNNAIKLGIIATICETGEPVLLENFNHEAELLTALRASAFIPGVSGDTPINFRGVNLIDGGYSAYLGDKIARKRGATHLLILTNLPAEQTHAEPSYAQISIAQTALQRLGSPAADTFCTLHEKHNAQLGNIRSSVDPTVAHCQLPADSPKINLLSINSALLWQGLEAGFQAMCTLLGHPDQPTPKLWKNLQKPRKKAR